MPINVIVNAVIMSYKNEFQDIISRFLPKDEELQHLEPDFVKSIYTHLVVADTLLERVYELWGRLIRTYHTTNFLTECRKLQNPESLLAPSRSEIIQLYETHLVYIPLQPVDADYFDHTKWLEYWTDIEEKFTAQFVNSPSKYLKTTFRTNREKYVASQREDVASRIKSREGEIYLALILNNELPALSEINSHLLDLNYFGLKVFEYVRSHSKSTKSIEDIH